MWFRWVCKSTAVGFVYLFQDIECLCHVCIHQPLSLAMVVFTIHSNALDKVSSEGFEEVAKLLPRQVYGDGMRDLFLLIHLHGKGIQEGFRDRELCDKGE